MDSIVLEPLPQHRREQRNDIERPAFTYRGIILLQRTFGKPNSDFLLAGNDTILAERSATKYVNERQTKSVIILMKINSFLKRILYVNKLYYEINEDIDFKDLSVLCQLKAEFLLLDFMHLLVLA